MKMFAALGATPFLLATALTAQEERAYLDAPVVVIDERVPPIKRLLDWDGDGRKELLGWYSAQGGAYHAHSVYIYGFNDGGWEHYSYNWFLNVYDGGSVPGDSYPMLVEVGHLGAPDGKEEVALIYGTRVQIREPGFPNEDVPDAYFLLSDRSVDGVVGDFDGDGGGDLAVLTSREIAYMLHRSGAHGYVQRSVPVSPGWQYLERGEFDGRPGDDVALVSATAVHFHSLQPPAPVAGGRSKLASAGFRTIVHGMRDPDPAVGDVDGDGLDDVVLFSMPNVYRVLRQVEPGRFRLGPKEIGGPATDLADIDADGDLDGICCGGGGGGPTFPFIPFTDFPSEFMLSPNRGDGTFEEAWTVPSNGAEFIAGADDLDGDGDVDLVAGRVAYWNPGALTRPIVPVPGVSEPLQSEIHDLDCDGDPDFAVRFDGYRRNLGDGTTVASAPILPDPPAGTTWLGPGYVGDFTGDGRVDLIVECWAGATFEGVHLLANQGGEVFSDAGVVCTPGEPFSSWTTLAQDNCVIADFDSNGTLDLALRKPRHTVPSEIVPLRTDLWLNDGVSALNPVPSWDEQRILAVGEFSADGLNDLIVYHNNGAYSGFRVRYGLPGGGWAPPETLTAYGAFGYVAPVQLWNDFFAVADINTYSVSAGVDEFIAYQRGNRYAKYTRGQPGGFWTYTTDLRLWLEDTIYYSEDVRYGVQLGDLDGDGQPGYLINTPLNAVESTWVAVEDFGAFGTENPASIQMLNVTAVADVDGDGDADGLGDRIVHARAFEGPSAGARHQYGVGVAGIGGIVPTIGATGPFRVGETIEVLIVGGLAGQTGELHVSRGAGPTPDFPVTGVTAYLDPADDVYVVVPVTLQGPAGPGAGHASVPLTVPAEYAGKIEYLQAFLNDPAAPNGVSATNGLRLTFGE